MIGGDGSAEERDNISFPPLKSTPHIAGKRRDGPEQPGLQSFSRPELALTQSLQFLASDDWERKVDGLSFIRRLSQHHPVILISRLHDVSLALVQEVKNLRSAVSRMAVVCLGDVFTFLKRRMDPELGNTVKVLLEKAGESNTFIRQSVDSTLDCMVQSCTPARAVNALLNGGLSHLNSRVRACMAHHLADLVERMGAHNLPRDITNRILPAATRLAQDASQETRYKLALFLDG
ncbi:TOG array regulator of axonemal microtubules protein 1-like [Lepisosteus oculatus]|uniref:TOG array regulator of axonemal microtubules protein 1-like n=1 Tax=Lepisosteus oculatus TaxID=7918 RepID=UPI0035F504E7